jgi:hypothetical protein
MIESTLSTEHRTLLAYLSAQRDHVLGILEGVDEAMLRRPILPSGWTCLGLVQHLAVDVERFWFRGVVAGDQAAIAELTDVGNAWQISADVSAEVVFDMYRQAIDRANAVIAATSLDAAPAWWPSELFGDWRLGTVREIVLHTMTETACHAGHLDAARELIDGRLWLVLAE